MKRVVASVALLALILQHGACSRRVPVLVDANLESNKPAIVSKNGVRIFGYVGAEGIYHEYHGQARVEADSIHFLGTSTSRMAESGEPGFVISRTEVQSLDLAVTNVPGTIAAVLVPVALVGALAAASCPFTYSYDGEQYVLDGEPCGGAISRGLERTDWSALEYLKEVNGEYRVRLGNEMDETQHVNDFALLVIDHEPGTTVVLDAKGTPHAFRALIPVSTARDGNGTDLGRWLGAKDQVVWEPDLAKASVDALNAPTRSRIELEFERPPGVDQAWLVADVATAHWGSTMIRNMLGLYGERLGEYYTALDSNPFFRGAVLAWQEREELFHLFVQVQEGTEWKRQSFIPGGGPYVPETRAVLVDLAGVVGDRVRIRLEPPIGFWSLNAFHLAWEETDVVATRVVPLSAIAHDGRDVSRMLEAVDGSYFDLPTTGDYADIRFPAPPVRRGADRKVFAVTRGWYEIHLDAHGAPAEAVLSRLRNEPGAVVRIALEDYREYARTEILRAMKPEFRKDGSY